VYQICKSRAFLILVIVFNGAMQERGTLLGRKFTEGRRYSSWPERAVIMAVFCSALFFFEDINLAVDSSFGVESEVLTVILLIFMIPLVSDFIFRIISSLTGVK
tara:strand:- start:97 stop:408 length:312 start_codon:yes stop_codon:yes gene_type:complete